MSVLLLSERMRLLGELAQAEQSVSEDLERPTNTVLETSLGERMERLANMVEKVIREKADEREAADREREQLRQIIIRQHCGCLQRHCREHGPYDPAAIEKAFRIIASGRSVDTEGEG